MAATLEHGARSRPSSSSKIEASTIGEDLVITGNVDSKSEIHLEGNVRGDVSCVALVLGENSKLEGNVKADDVVVRGRLIGSVKAMRVTLHSTSHVEGDLHHQSLAIEQGAYFDGNSRRCEDPFAPPMNIGETTAQAASEPAERRNHRPGKAFVRSLPGPE
ncbi:MAG: polymer-forming cytoskeletal protein [Methyloceanibacter sp.]